MKHKSVLLLKTAVATLLCCLCLDAIAEPARTFSHPDRIRYDSQCLTIDGKDVFIYSGAFHYFRCPKELWHDRFQKIKDAGFNTVETYVPWNWCEPQMPDGTNDFSKVHLQDFDDWLTMAEQFGFYVIVRPGPYICAEWNTGGYPQWLMTKQPEHPLRSEGWLRSDDPVYLSWCKHWYDEVCPVIAKHQITRKAPGQPGVILVQVENEYDYADFPDHVKINQVKALAEDAWANGIDVPLITCWTHQVRGSTDPVLRQIFDCCNFYPRWDVDSTGGSMEQLRREQPDAPMATTELQGGWFSNVGGPLSQDQDGITASQINNLTLFAIQHGETLLNYYMLFGGTNPDDWAARDITTTYDYNAPIREWGGVGARYQRVQAIARMLQEHGADLVRALAVPLDVNVPQKDVTVVERRAVDGGRYFFIRTSQHDEPRNGTATVRETTGGSSLVINYRLEPFGSKILYLAPGVNNPADGEWLPEKLQPIARPAHVPAGVAITSARMRVDPGPKHWTKIKSFGPLWQEGVDDSHFLFYRAEVSCPSETNLLVEYPDGDAVVPSANGKTLARLGGTDTKSVFQLGQGREHLVVLYENHGHANGGQAMENPSGLRAMSTSASPLAAGTAIGGWRMKIVEGTSNRPEVDPAFDDSDWTPVPVDNLEANQLTPNQAAVFRSQIELTEPIAGKVVLAIGRIDDQGWVYVNGQEVGTTTDWSRNYSFDITKAVRPGTNSIAVVVQNVADVGGLGRPMYSVVANGPPVRLQAFGRPAGDEQQWWQTGLHDQKWMTIPIGADASASPSGAMLTWYRMDFALPPSDPSVWVPWRLHLEAAGNGFVYLNGHALGRYWDAGPQHDFFLPECWLHFGDSQSNNITLDLRPTGSGAAIHSAMVAPYSHFAEMR